MRDLADPTSVVRNQYLFHLLYFHPNQQPTLEYKKFKPNQKIYLSTMDLLVPATMKNAAKRDM